MALVSFPLLQASSFKNVSLKTKIISYKKKMYDHGNHFETLISEEACFCITLNAYTPIKNLRYMNINVYHILVHGFG